MKNLLKISAVIFLSLLVSCSKGDDNDDGDDLSNSELIIGSWRIESRTTNGVNNTLEECDLLFTITFNSDLDYRSYELSGDNCSTNTQATGTYTISGNTLTVSQGMEMVSGEITTLNQDKLSLRFTIDETVVENYRRL